MRGCRTPRIPRWLRTVRRSSLRAAVLYALDLGAEGAQPLVDPFVAALDLRHVVDGAFAIRRHRGDEHRHAGADVGGIHGAAPELRRTRHQRAMRIAEHDPRAHPNELVD